MHTTQSARFDGQATKARAPSEGAKMTRFRDRIEAGRLLGTHLRESAGSDALVLGLARGGVPVAYEVARALDAQLDVLVVRKLGVPGHPELAMGAVAPGGTRVLNESVLKGLHIPDDLIDRLTIRDVAEIARREQAYRRGKTAPPVLGRRVIIVDDGLATGASMRAAIAWVRRGAAQGTVVAVPTGSAQTCEELRQLADAVVCLTTPEPFLAVGLWYEDFSPTSDDEVRALLDRATRERERSRPAQSEKGARHV
jgi:predicted phosphoribosyltransferase